MRFMINHELLAQSRAILANRSQLYWVVGGAGSGKSTICEALATRFAVPIYDMDAHIYGTYHGRFTPQRHPVNTAWATAPNGLAWLLDMSWETFNQFNQAALPEYLDLLAEDLAPISAEAPLLIDGGICNPALLAKAIAPTQIICLARPARTSAEIWSENAERQAMKGFMDHLPNPEQAWQRFLTFDQHISQTILQECEANGIAVCVRNEADSVDELADRVASRLKI